MATSVTLLSRINLRKRGRPTASDVSNLSADDRITSAPVAFTRRKIPCGMTPGCQGLRGGSNLYKAK